MGGPRREHGQVVGPAARYHSAKDSFLQRALSLPESFDVEPKDAGRA